jgi:hypothetical protein
VAPKTRNRFKQPRKPELWAGTNWLDYKKKNYGDILLLPEKSVIFHFHVVEEVHSSQYSVLIFQTAI